MEDVQSYGCSRIRFFSAAVLPRCKPAYSLAAPRSLPKGVTWHMICWIIVRMKKLLYILFALILGLGMNAGAKESGSKVYWICSGTGTDVVYTVRGDMICSGTGYDVVYTIR